LYHAHGAGSFDSLNLKVTLQDTLATVGQIVAHNGYLFAHVFSRTGSPRGDTAYIAVLNTSTLTLEKTIGLPFRAYDSSSPLPRVFSGKWYLCGKLVNVPYQIEAVEVIDLNTRAHGGTIVFSQLETIQIQDFVATGPGQGYVVHTPGIYRVKKVTF
jgi:hypothetical protein